MKKHEEEIKIREYIIQKAHKGEKITAEERLWLQTHSVYNWKLDYPYYNVVIENIEPSKWYKLKIIIESINYDNYLRYALHIHDKEGKIIGDGIITDINGNITKKKFVKMLVFDVNPNETNEVYIYSSIGALSIVYGCDYYDPLVKLHKRELSSTWNPNFAMVREEIKDNKVRYRCKSPLSDSFDALVFTVEWIPANEEELEEIKLRLKK